MPNQETVKKLTDLIEDAILNDEHKLSSILLAVLGAYLCGDRGDDLEILSDTVAQCVKETLVPMNNARMEEFRKSSQN